MIKTYMYNEQPLWCVAQKMKMTSLPGGGDLVTVIEFGKRLTYRTGRESMNTSGKWVYVSCSCPDENQNGRFVKKLGWVNRNALSEKRVEAMDGLFCRNAAGRKIPVAKHYRGKVSGLLRDGETVKMIARVGEWCLTSKGWSKWRWFAKSENIFDFHSANMVVIAMVGQAYNDYCSELRILKKNVGEEFDKIERPLSSMQSIEEWISGSKYESMFKSSIEEMGIDPKWLEEKREQLRKRYAWIK